jgi:glutathione S-transferase
MELGYWGIKGIVEPVRWAILALGLHATEKNPASREEWAESKKALNTEFPNLPYLQDGDFVLTESSAIPLYLAHKAGKPEFFGKDFKDQAIVRQIEGVLGDIRSNLFKVFAAENPGENFKSQVTGDGAVAVKLGFLNKFLGDKHFFLGYLTWVDLQFAYLAELIDALAASFGHKSIIAHHAHLQGLSTRIHEHEALKARVVAGHDVLYMPPTMLKFKFFTYKETLEFNSQ